MKQAKSCLGVIGNDRSGYRFAFESIHFIRIEQANVQIQQFQSITQMARRHWTKRQDQAVRNSVQHLELSSWTLVARKLEKDFPDQARARTGKQCRFRWLNHLAPNISNQPWTKDQEKSLNDLHAIYGNKWKLISKLLPTRAQNHIKNHFYAKMRKGVRRLNRLLQHQIGVEDLRKIQPLIFSRPFDKNGVNSFSGFAIDQPRIKQNFLHELLQLAQKNLDFQIQVQFRPQSSLYKLGQAFLSHLVALNNEYQDKKQRTRTGRRSVEIKTNTMTQQAGQLNEMKAEEQLNLGKQRERSLDLSESQVKIVQTQQFGDEIFNCLFEIKSDVKAEKSS